MIRRLVEGCRLSDPLFVERFIHSIYVDDLTVDQTVKKELLNCTLSPGSVWLKRDSTSGSSSPIRVIPWAVRNELDSTPQICVQFIIFA